MTLEQIADELRSISEMSWSEPQEIVYRLKSFSDECWACDDVEFDGKLLALGLAHVAIGVALGEVGRRDFIDGLNTAESKAREYIREKGGSNA